MVLLVTFFLLGLIALNMSNLLNKVDGPPARWAKVASIYPDSWPMVGTLQKFLE